MNIETEAMNADFDAAEFALNQRTRDRELAERLVALRKAAGTDEPETPVARAYRDLMHQVDADEIEALVTQLHERGYVIVEGLLDDAQVDHARQVLEPMYDGVRKIFASPEHIERGTKQTVHVQNVLAKTDGIDAIATLPRLRALVAGILGIDFIMNAGAVAMSPDPGCSPQGLHRDDGFFAHFPRPRIPLVVTAAIALDDFAPENGGTQIVPGSNCWVAERQPGESDIMRCSMPAGSVLVWDGAVLHGGGGNTTRRSRRTLTLNYTRGWLRTQFNQYLSIPRERVLSMSPELQADLGYHRSSMGLGGCDLQDPLAYLRLMQKGGGDGAQPGLGYESRVDMQA
ncbi:MAG: hypothetical protein CMQ24_17950 [Gammaproteobacteria bacterium]|nr:hypothetical protein [Gammaproteobacteria bacterium]